MKKAGFTLAEVLIVLVILGVIASMTVPSLMSNSNQTVYITGAQKAYSTLNNAIQMASINDGATPADMTEISTAADMAEKVFAKNLKISRKISDTAYQTQDGFIYYIYSILSPTGTNVTTRCSDVPEDPIDVNADTACALLVVDTNGDIKTPNAITNSNLKSEIQDRFLFFVYKNGVAGGYYPIGAILRNDFATSSSATNYTTHTDPVMVIQGTQKSGIAYNNLTTINTQFQTEIKGTQTSN